MIANATRLENAVEAMISELSEAIRDVSVDAIEEARDKGLYATCGVLRERRRLLLEMRDRLIAVARS